MKRLKLYFFATLLIVLIVPMVALAPWWNPLTWNWNIFNIFLKHQTSIIQPEKIVSSDQKEADQQLYSIVKNNLGGYILSRKIDISDSLYSIEKREGYDLLRFSDHSQDFNITGDSGKPTLPVYQFNIPLPLDAKIRGVKVNFGTRKLIGKFNLPIINPQPNCMGCASGSLYSPHPKNGIVPQAAYHFEALTTIGNQAILNVSVYPVTYDNFNGDTYVYSSFQISAEYTTVGKIIIDRVKPTQADSFNAGEDIPISALVKNMTPDSADINIVASLSLADGVNKIILSKQSRQSVAGGSTAMVSTTIKAPEDNNDGKVGFYFLNLDILDGSNNIYSNSMMINIKPKVYVDISCFKYPAMINYQPQGSSGFYMFESCLTNPTNQKIRAYINIDISSYASTLVHLPQSYVDLNPGETKSYKTGWIPSNPSLQSGQYQATLTVSTDKFETFETGFFKYSSEAGN